MLQRFLSSGRSISLILVLAGAPPPVGAYQCPEGFGIFYEAWQDLASVQAHGGALWGSGLSFVPAVKGNGARFSGDASITFTSSAFQTPSGSVAFWFRKNHAAVTEGGILQLGSFTADSAFGVFYENGMDLFFQLRIAGQIAQAYRPSAISDTAFTHITVAWDSRGERRIVKLFVNGKWDEFGGSEASGAFAPSSQLQIGWVNSKSNAEGVVDELRVFDYMLSDGEAYAEYVYSADRFCRQPSAKPPSEGQIQVVGNELHVGGSAFTVKGIGYEPIPKSMPGNPESAQFIYSNQAILDRDMPLLRAMGVNTVRVWETLDPDTEQLLDKLWNGGTQPIYAILGFPVDGAVDYADDPPGTVSDAALAVINDVKAYVTAFEAHPAVLAWALGNEMNLHYQHDLKDWFKLANRMAAATYDVETANGTETPRTYHPVILTNSLLLDVGDTAVGSDDASLDMVDLWGHNAYVRKDYHCYFDYYEALSAKPLVVTEFGIDAYDTMAVTTNEVAQADWDVAEWRQIEARTSGGVVFEYADEYWKDLDGTLDGHDLGGHTTDVHPDEVSNEEWYGVMEIADGTVVPNVLERRKAYCALKAEFSDIAAPDFDRDNDVDQSDFGHFQACYTEPDQKPVASCLDADMDCDEDVDLTDFNFFLACASGPAVPPSQGCFDVLGGIAQNKEEQD